jgi:hypothetical protein
MNKKSIFSMKNEECIKYNSSTIVYNTLLNIINSYGNYENVPNYLWHNLAILEYECEYRSFQVFAKQNNYNVK